MNISYLGAWNQNIYELKKFIHWIFENYLSRIAYDNG